MGIFAEYQCRVHANPRYNSERYVGALLNITLHVAVIVGTRVNQNSIS